MIVRYTFHRFNEGLTKIIGLYSPIVVFSDDDSEKIVLCFADLQERHPKLFFAKVDLNSFHSLIVKRKREQIWLNAKNRKSYCRDKNISYNQKTIQVDFIARNINFI